MDDLYAQDGVNVAAGDAFSAFAARMAVETFSPYIKVFDWSKGHFRGPKTFIFVGLPPGVQFDVAADGVGTKVIIITEALSHRQAGHNVVAMTFGDITRFGGKPVLFSNVLDLSKLGEAGSDSNRLMRLAIMGLCEVLREQQAVLYRGETAELGPCVGSENPDAVTMFNWAGFAIGIYHPDNVITGEDIRPGDVVMALKDDAFGSNGLSSVRAALRMQFGERWWTHAAAAPYIRQAALPCRLYDRFLTKLNGWESPDFKPMIKVCGIAHLSGGGIPSKFGKDILFPQGLSAELTDLHQPPTIMRQCAQWRNMPDRKIYTTWHGGQRVLAVIRPEDEELFGRAATDAGVEANRCGVIKEGSGSPRLLLKSQFSGNEIEYGAKDEDI